MRYVYFLFVEPQQIERKSNKNLASRENGDKRKEMKNKTIKILCKIETKFSHKLRIQIIMLN